VTALPDGWAPVRLIATLPPEGDDELLLRAARGTVLLVRVVGLDDSPRPGARIVLRAVPPYLGSDLPQLISRPAITDATGTAALRNLAPGSYEVSVAGRDDLPPAAVVVQDGAESLLRSELP